MLNAFQALSTTFYIVISHKKTRDNGLLNVSFFFNSCIHPILMTDLFRALFASYTHGRQKTREFPQHYSHSLPDDTCYNSSDQMTTDVPYMQLPNQC